MVLLICELYFALHRATTQRLIQRSVTQHNSRSSVREVPKLDGHSWTVKFPVYIDCTYLDGRYDEQGVARHGYAADAPFIETPRDAREHYRKQFSIESACRLAKQSLALTSSRDAGFRLLLFVVSLLLQNVWRYLYWMYVAAPRYTGTPPFGVVVRRVL